MRAIHAQRGGIASLIARARPAAAASPPLPICLALCTPPACRTCGAHAAPLARGAGSCATRPSSLAMIKGSTGTFSPSCACVAALFVMQLRPTRARRARARRGSARLWRRKICTRGVVRTCTVESPRVFRCSSPSQSMLVRIVSSLYCNVCTHSHYIPP